MRRPIIYAQEQNRTYDFLRLARETLFALGISIEDLLGSTAAMATGLAATPTGPASLNVSVAAGRIYQVSQTDSSAYGTLGSDTNLTVQQGFAAAQSLMFSTAGLTSGQSQWALVQATFTQSDTIPADDPNSGILNFFNINNPSNPFIGPGNTGAASNTDRNSVCTLSIKYGTAATTGSEVPPAADANHVGLYLVDLAYGQTQITSGQILVAGPSVGANVPNNYPQAPFLAGLLNSHHGGGAGQAPKIRLGSEVQGMLGLPNLPVSSAVSGGGLSTTYEYPGNPNGHVPGVAAVVGVSPPDLCWDTTDGILYYCTTGGNAAAAVWSVQKGITNPTASDNTAQLATDAFVQEAILQFTRTLTSAAGDYTFPGGFILQWGLQNVAFTGSSSFVDQAISFPEPFPTACFHAFGIAKTNVNFNPAVAGDIFVVATHNESTTGFNARVDTNSGGTPTGTCPVSWFAIGK